MKALLWIALLTAIALLLILPASYLYVAGQLPKLDSEFDLDEQLKLSVEGERRSLRLGQIDRGHRPLEFVKPELSKLPKDFVSLYLAQLGCPNFFGTPREQGFNWAWRIFHSLIANGPLPGDGACEQFFAEDLAGALGIKGKSAIAVAAYKLHAFLQKDQLVAYDLETLYFDRGVVGVEDASWALFHKDLGELPLAVLAELSLALPVNGFYDDVDQCRNATLIRQGRDRVLSMAVDQGLIPDDRAKAASATQVACLAAP